MLEFSGSGLVDFTQIAPSIWGYTPASLYHLHCPLSAETEAPSLVLLCTWTGAQHQHIATYTTEYRRRFPSTRIMVVTTSIKDLCFRTSRQKKKRLKPAVEQIMSYERSNPPGRLGTILMHVFSEGGSHKACELAEAYYNITATRMLVSALCFDSTPGRPRFTRLCKAIDKTLPPFPLVRYTGLLFSGTLLGCIWILYSTVKGFENNIVSKTRQRILDPKYWDLTAFRCYLYSKADEMVFWQDIDDHVNESILKGIPVLFVRFHTSEHVRHALSKEDVYWNAVMATWERTMSTTT